MYVTYGGECCWAPTPLPADMPVTLANGALLVCIQAVISVTALFEYMPEHIRAFDGYICNMCILFGLRWFLAHAGTMFV